MNNFKGYSRVIKDMPYHCTHCRAKVAKDKIQHINIEGNKKEPFCNIDCAIAETRRRRKQYVKLKEQIEQREIELTYLKNQEAK